MWLDKGACCLHSVLYPLIRTMHYYPVISKELLGSLHGTFGAFDLTCYNMYCGRPDLTVCLRRCDYEELLTPDSTLRCLCMKGHIISTLATGARDKALLGNGQGTINTFISQLIDYSTLCSTTSSTLVYNLPSPNSVQHAYRPGFCRDDHGGPST